MSAITTYSAKLMLIGEQIEQLEPVLESVDEEIVSCTSFRKCKKMLRDESLGVLLFVIDSDANEDLALQLFDFVRNGLKDEERVLLVAHTSEREPKALQWIEEFNINGFLNLDIERQELNQKLIQRNVQNWQRNMQRHAQHKAENDLLMCVTRFSKHSENLNGLVDTFSQSLANLSFASGSCRIQIGNDGTGGIKSTWPAEDEFSTFLTDAFDLPALPSYLNRALIEKKPQIDLLSDDHKLKSLGNLLDIQLGSYLVFPLAIYDRVYELMIFFIPEAQMDSVSIRQIEIISKASEQLTMLLERREAELRLKKQYNRLKSTLVELKETQEQLAYSEKMSTVGQLAAGIAHEINNPLGYVMSNFGSINEYLGSIIHLQDMHESFLDAIEKGNQNTIHQIKSDIADYRGQSGIEFIYSDIRDIVSESRDGLNRVKEIIADLQSFAHSGKAETSEVDLSKCIDQTLKLLKPIIEQNIKIDIRLGQDHKLQSHTGFVQQILTNLIKNAIEATKEAKVPEPSIAISSNVESEIIFISVRDNGPGISAEAQKNVFDPFYTTKDVGKGTGLGLSVTYNLAKKLGGDITINSVKGEYCEFVLSLPVKGTS